MFSNSLKEHLQICYERRYKFAWSTKSKLFFVIVMHSTRYILFRYKVRLIIKRVLPFGRALFLEEDEVSFDGCCCQTLILSFMVG